MRATLAIARRELEQYFATPMGWLCLCGFVLVTGFFFALMTTDYSVQASQSAFNPYMQEEMNVNDWLVQPFFANTAVILLLLCPALSMRLFAEDRRQRSLELLLSSPIGSGQIVLGKYLGALGFLTIVKSLTLFMPALVEINGKVSWSQIGAGYLGLFALGAAVVAIGTFASTVSRNQLLAAVLGGSIVGVLILAWLLSRVSDPPLKDVFAYMALFDKHFQPFMRGRINTESLVYYASVSFGFLLLATRALKARRWV